MNMTSQILYLLQPLKELMEWHWSPRDTLNSVAINAATEASSHFLTRTGFFQLAS